MATLGQFEKPEAGQFKDKRKLFLIPNFAFGADAPDDVQVLLDKLWSEIRDHVSNLERSLGGVKHIYHEMVHTEGEEGLKIVEMLNPKGHAYIHALCQSTAQLEATEDIELFNESTDWQRCMSVGLSSRKVMDHVMESYRESTKKRYEHISARIDETLQDDEVGMLFVRQDHAIQFPEGVQVFYVAPPALNEIKRWLDDRMQTFSQAADPVEDTESVGDAEPSTNG